jgi:hypothetical protein
LKNSRLPIFMAMLTPSELSAPILSHARQRSQQETP